ncbi:predicted protein [Naegleria gruberi]|uniref:Predicted protein n=1 Tax=Naegleria gruberi TaxID=5762 RepID=D2W2N6_NAEGR|nr:uncharacterized protein NAEGRDRAFT_75653 [Naegleria gruberi]EFC36679.1 predicted protein [Naegleria gruberi]|eukprot:XP_002669423.1 predicted protein [Naegleria gruberi strain NEG-M]
MFNSSPITRTTIHEENDEDEQQRSGGWFHSRVPPEVLYSIISYLDFRSIMMIIPRVCSSWREIIIQQINTLHIYPNIDLYGGDFDHLFSSEKEEQYQKHMMIEKDIIPFVKYLHKFVESNRMKIFNLFIYGSIQEANLDRYAPSRPRNTHFPSLHQQRKKEFSQRVVNYLPNYFTEPTFSMETSYPTNCSFIKLDFNFDSNAFCNLFKACKDNLQTVVLKTCKVDQPFCQCFDWVKDKLENLVLDNVTGFLLTNTSEFENLKYLYHDTEYSIASNVLESMYIGPKFFELNNLSNCKKLSLHLNYTKAAQLNQLSSTSNNIVEELEVTLGTVQYSYWEESLSIFDTVEMTKAFLELLAKFKCVKKLSINLDGVFDFALMRHSSPIFLTSDPNLKELPNVLELKLEGRSFFTNRIDRWITHFPNIKLFSCHVDNENDIDLLQNSLYSLKTLEELDLSIRSFSYGELSSKLIETLLFVFKEGGAGRSFLKSLCIRGYGDCREQNPELDKLLEFMSGYAKPAKVCLVPRKHTPALQSMQSKYANKVDLQVLESQVLMDKSLENVKPIDYSQSIDEILEQRRDLSNRLKTSSIICLYCGCLVQRCDYSKHNQICHSGNELEYDLKVAKQVDLSEYETHCPSCHKDIKRRDFSTHECTETRIKLPVIPTSSTKFHYQ